MSKQTKIFDEVSEPECLLASYVPRHIRLGYKPKERKIESFHEYPGDPIVVGDGDPDFRIVTQKRVPVSESMSKYRVEDFKLANLLAANVPLSVVNLEMSQRRSIEEIQSIVSKCSDLEEYERNLLKNKADFESMFNNVSNSEKLSES